MTFRGSPLFLNPLVNPIFLPVLEKVIIGFVLGLLLVWVLNGFTFKNFRESKVGQIYLGWLLLIPVYLTGIFFGWLSGMFVIFLFMSLAIREFSKLSALPRAYKVILVVLAALAVFIAAFFPVRFYSLPFFFFALLSTVAIRRNDAEDGFKYSAYSLYGAIWIILGLAHVELLAHLNGRVDLTSALPLMLVFATTLSDIGAYVFGKLFHRLNFLDQYKIAPAISPNKTYIGILGHIIGAGLGVWTMYFALSNYLPWYHWVIVSILIGFYGSIGGMINSTFKRYFNTKDSSSFLPGHGGVMDRIDSTIRVAVVLYYYLLIFWKF